MPAYAQNDTAFASVAYDAAGKNNADTSKQNYVLFYQHSSGDIRKMVWNQTTWYPSEFVTNSARIGTGLSAVSFGAPPTLIYLYYTDRDGILQELRGAHASNEWNNGTLGTAGFKVTNSHSALSAKYQGKCGKRGNIGWVLYQSDAGIQEALWDHDQDSWSNQVLFKDIQPGSDLVSTIESSATTAWRLFGIKKNLQLQEYLCNTACTNASNPWVQGESIVSRMDGSRIADDKGAKGLNGVAVTNSTLELGGASVNDSRLIYFQDPQSNIRESNNTDFSNPTGLSEGWVANASTCANVGLEANSSGAGIIVTPAMKGSKIHMASGFKGLTPQMFLFYQANGTDVTVRTRLQNQVGQWSDPVALPVGV